MTIAKIKQEFYIATDTATFTAFDPAVLTQRQNDEPDWWACEFSQLEEVLDGRIAMVGLAGDGGIK